MSRPGCPTASRPGENQPSRVPASRVVASKIFERQVLPQVFISDGELCYVQLPPGPRRPRRRFLTVLGAVSFKPTPARLKTKSLLRIKVPGAKTLKPPQRLPFDTSHSNPAELSFDLFVRTIRGETIAMRDLVPSTTVLELKWLLWEKEGVPVWFQTLVFGTRV